VDLVLGYSLKVGGNPVTFQLGVNNLTNKSYWTGNRIWGTPREFSLLTRYQF
jgi:outer membrane receptor protein involved in Fe transport